MNSLTVKAHAKINLTLDVGPRRPDGFHDIRSIMQTLALHDMVEVALTPGRPGVHLTVEGDEAEGVPTDETNIVHRAAARLQVLVPAAPGVAITLIKRLPSQAGLGGGSSDAAATLRAVNALLNLHLPPSDLSEIAATLGADVPFFLTGGTALVEGLGERVTRLPALPALNPDWPLVIVKPPVGVSTAWAYGALDALAEREKIGTMTDSWLHEPHDGRSGNDFEQVILTRFAPIAAAYAALDETNTNRRSFKPLLCGSGSALFQRVPSDEDAEQLAERLRKANLGKVWVTRTHKGNA